VTLVGHSMGGMVIALASDQRSERVDAAIYVSAFLLPDGKSIFEYSQTTREFASSLLPKYLVVDQENGVSLITPEGLREAFLADASNEDFAWAKQCTQVDYLAPSGTPVSLGGGFDSVPRFYVEPVQDRAVPIEAQRKMAQEAGVREVVTLDGSHSAYITKAGEVADAILAFADAS